MPWHLTLTHLFFFIIPPPGIPPKSQNAGTYMPVARLWMSVISDGLNIWIKRTAADVYTWSHIQRLLSVQFLYFQFKNQCPLRNVSVRKQAVCARALSVLKPLAHDSILFHPTSSSSLKHKRKDERKHKKRSVCDCCIGIMYSPKPTQLLFDPPSTSSPSTRGISPSSPFRASTAEGGKREAPSKCSHVRAGRVNAETCSFYFSERSVKKAS